MARFVKGDVVVVPFPFSDIIQSKRRPAVVIASLDGDDVILCQITSKMIKDKYALALEDTEFEAGGLKQSSSIRPNRVFTADSHIILYRIGKLRVEKISEIIDRVIEIVKA